MGDEKAPPRWARYVECYGPPCASLFTLWSRHLLQLQRTLDGNFQLNRMKKNSDPDDISLCNGKGHFPKHSTLDQYLASIDYKEEVNKLLSLCLQSPNKSLEIELCKLEGMEWTE
jgi:hypothetical protein